MKRRAFMVLFLAIFCLPLFAGGNKDSGTNSSGKTFGYVPTNMNNPFFHTIQSSIEETLKANGDRLISVDPQSDPARQLNMIDDLIRQKVAGIFLCPIDSDGVKNGLLACQRANIPVIAVDNGVADSNLVISTVQSDNYNAGKVVGDDMLKNVRQGGKVIILGYPSALSARLRVQGFKDAVAGRLQIVGEFDGGADTAVSLKPSEDSLQANPDLAAFFAINDPSALGAVQAVEAAKKTGIAVYSVDGAPEGKIAIQQGKLLGTGAQSPINIGKISVEVMYKHLNGEKVNAETLVDTFIINRDNVSRYNPTGWQ
jgi:ribose transport system substrate-binding protein